MFFLHPLFILLVLIVCVVIGLALFGSLRKSTSSILGDAASISGNNNDAQVGIIHDLQTRLTILEKEKRDKQSILRQLQNGEEPNWQNAHSASTLPKGTASCTKCGNALEENMHFCPQCGEVAPPKTQEDSICSSCGNVLTGYKKFCPQCGKPVAKVSSAQQATSTQYGVAYASTGNNCSSSIYNDGCYASHPKTFDLGYGEPINKIAIVGIVLIAVFLFSYALMTFCAG